MAGKDLKNDGGPAFPQLDMVAGERDGHGDIIEAYLCAAGGMTLRDWFAGQALGAIISKGPRLGELSQVASAVVRESYEIADAMITARGAQ